MEVIPPEKKLQIVFRNINGWSSVINESENVLENIQIGQIHKKKEIIQLN
jgi:hypothetical protein